MRVYKAAALLIDAEHTRCVATQKGGFGVSVEPEIVEPLRRLGRSYHGIVGPEHDLVSAVAAHVLHQLRDTNRSLGSIASIECLSSHELVSAVARTSGLAAFAAFSSVGDER